MVPDPSVCSFFREFSEALSEVGVAVYHATTVKFLKRSLPEAVALSCLFFLRPKMAKLALSDLPDRGLDEGVPDPSICTVIYPLIDSSSHASVRRPESFLEDAGSYILSMPRTIVVLITGITVM